MVTGNLTPAQIMAVVAENLSTGINRSVLTFLIERLNEVNGCKFVKLAGYCSDASEQTELAEHIINIGFRYENMKAKDIDLLEKVNTSTVDLNSFSYENINFNGKTLDEYKRAVEGEMNRALFELKESAVQPIGESGRQNNDVWLVPRILVFNTNTNKLSVVGQSMSKTVILEGDVKVTKKSPRTFAKEVLRKVAGLKTNQYRRFLICNMGAVNVSGNTVSIS